MNLEDFHRTLDTTRGHPLNVEQRQVVDHGQGPLWLLAGPGSGKSEVLVTRALRLVCVDRIRPESIILTTFTEKAGRNLQDRMASYFGSLQIAAPDLADIDIAAMRIGTLHSLCNDILQEYRYREYQNVRLMDEVEQAIFVYEEAEISDHTDIPFWAAFDYAVPDWNVGAGKFPPSKWRRARAAITLFSRLAEDLIDLNRLAASGPHWHTLVTFYRQYQDALRQNHRCDFATLQLRFLNFLRAPAEGGRFLSGDEERPAIKYVLVDEYQDTNPVQEQIYLALAAPTPHNLVVVGDDDQALYRFRGGTVDCMVHFGSACRAVFMSDPSVLQLRQNYRSHPQIVDFFNDYIASHPEMSAPDVRAPNKRPTAAASHIAGAYPAVAWISARSASELAPRLASFIKDHLVDDGVVQDVSQCVLLMKSVKDSPRNAGPYIAALQAAGLSVYNPRSQSFMECEEVQCLLHALVSIVDLNDLHKDLQGKELPLAISNWQDRFRAVGPVILREVSQYIARSQRELRARCAIKPTRHLDLTLLDIVYRLLAHEPFKTWRRDPERNLRLSKVTRLLEGYHSLELDKLVASRTGPGLEDWFVRKFFYTMLGYLVEAGVNEDEDEDMIVPLGRIPIMTIHQAKGLEFPFVFVAHLEKTQEPGAAQILDQILEPFRSRLYPRRARPPADLAVEDDIRLWYVAYSRAQHGLVLVATEEHLKPGRGKPGKVSIPGRDFVRFKRTVHVVQA